MLMRWRVGFLVSLAATFLSVPAFPDLKFITPQDQFDAAKKYPQMHPWETPRTDQFWVDMKDCGKMIVYANRFAGVVNNKSSKTFHEGVIGMAPIRTRFINNPNIPEKYRHGLMSPKLQGREFYGFSNHTTGRFYNNTWQGWIDVTGLSFIMDIDGHLVVHTGTGSKGAFADTGPKFAELGYLQTKYARRLAFYSDEFLEQQHLALHGHGERVFERRDFATIRTTMAWLGVNLGELIFILKRGFHGGTTLAGASISGRRSPFAGYDWKKIGFGSETMLVTDEVPLAERSAFRVYTRLKQNAFNQRLYRERIGFFTAIKNAVFGPRNVLSREFDKWLAMGQPITYEWVLVPQKSQTATPVERASAGWDTEEEYVFAETDLMPRIPDAEVGSFYTIYLPYLAEVIPGNPGWNLHYGLGNLAVMRGAAEGAYWAGAAARGTTAIALDTGTFGPKKHDENLEYMRTTVAKYFTAYQKRQGGN